MRVLMVTWDFPPNAAGGMSAHVDGLAQAMARAGNEVVIVTRRVAGTDPDSIHGNVRVLRADVDLPWLPDDVVAHTASGNHALVEATAMLHDWRADIVHAHDWNVGWAAAALATLHRAPLVTTLHGTERGRQGGHLPPGQATDVNSVEWWLTHRSSRVISSTKLLIREIVDGFEADPDRVKRVPAGIDPTWWQTTAAGETPGPRTGLVFAWGRVQYEKGFQVLARAISTLRYRVAGIECMIAGRGSYLPELQSQIDIAGAGDMIDLPGYITDDDLRAAIHRAGCVVIPSLYEPFGVVALEALAGGAPLIVADTGGLAELVGGTRSALLFEPGNADELAERIELVLTDESLANEMVRTGRDLLEATYSWHAIALRTLAVYADALGD